LIHAQDLGQVHATGKQRLQAGRRGPEDLVALQEKQP
jgi:hypothetical protein